LEKAERDQKKDTQRLKVIKGYLAKNTPIPAQYKPHYECHIQPGFLLIWGVDLQANELILVRCGSHAELFG